MMIMADNTTSGIHQFGQIPNNQARPLVGSPRQASSVSSLDAPNAFDRSTGKKPELSAIPTAFGGSAGASLVTGNTLLAAQIQTSVATPRQVASGGGGTPTQYRFGANTTAQIDADQRGKANMDRQLALDAGGASGDVVTKTGASFTG